MCVQCNVRLIIVLCGTAATANTAPRKPVLVSRFHIERVYYCSSVPACGHASHIPYRNRWWSAWTKTLVSCWIWQSANTTFEDVHNHTNLWESNMLIAAGAVILNGSSAGVSRVNADDKCSARMVNFNPLPKSHLWIVWFRIWHGWWCSGVHLYTLPSLVETGPAVAPRRDELWWNIGVACLLLSYFRKLNSSCMLLIVRNRPNLLGKNLCK